MAFKGDAFFINFSAVGQREYLKAARIGQNGVRPLHEAVQAAQARHQCVAWAQVQVIGICQHQAGPQHFQLYRGDSFDGGLCANRSEERREQIAVRGMKNARAGVPVTGMDVI